MLPNSAQFGDWCAAPFPLGSEGHAHEIRSYIHLVGIASENFDQLVQIVPTSAVRSQNEIAPQLVVCRADSVKERRLEMKSPHRIG